MTRLPAIREAKLALNPNVGSARIFCGWVDTMNEAVYGDSALEVMVKLIAQQAGEPPILIPMPQGPDAADRLTLFTRWLLRVRPTHRATIELTAFDPLVAATHALDLIINGGDGDDEASADPEARPQRQSG
jgi:hypothetical protein